MKKKYGEIHLILGPMFSGKSTDLLRRMKRYSIAKKKCLYIKYLDDDRYSLSNISTHDFQKCGAVAYKRLADIDISIILKYDCIGIDEGQFFPDIVEYADYWASQYNKIIIVAALDGTFERKPFGKILDLIPCSETVTKLKAVCPKCGMDAPFSARKSDEKEVISIGGSEEYLSLCRKCYLRFRFIQKYKPRRKKSLFISWKRNIRKKYINYIKNIIFS